MSDPYEIAAWRFERIAPLVDPSLDRAAKRNALRERYSVAVEWPLSATRHRQGLPPKKKPIPKSTLNRWVRAFERDGYKGLLPKRRSDRNVSRRAGTSTWISYAIGLLYEQPHRSLTQLDQYLRLEFEDYDIGRSTLDRHVRAHPAFNGVKALRSGRKSRLRGLYETARPHECWQLDGKGPFRVHFNGGSFMNVHVLSILDDYSRAILATVVAKAEDTESTVRVFKIAAQRYGLADRFQFDRGSAFDSEAFRGGIGQLGVHRNFVRSRQPETQGKIEAYHRSLKRWFVVELKAQEVVDLEHLELLLRGMIGVLYNRHRHQTIGTTPEARLAGCISPRRVSAADLDRAFFRTTTKKSHPKTGQVRLPNGEFKVPRPYAGHRHQFRYDPFSDQHAFLVTRDDHELALEPFVKKRPFTVEHPEEKRGTGQLQKILDHWQGKHRPNAQPGFGLPEVFIQLGKMLGRFVPDSEREARDVLAFYTKYGPLPRAPFEEACRKTREALGTGRPLRAYLDHLQRHIRDDDDDHQPQPAQEIDV